MAEYFKQPSVMTANQHFSQVPGAQISRSRFDRSHAYKTTYDAGRLVPVFLEMDVLPGDTHTVHCTQFSRLATPLRPIMDNIQQDVHFWFVPMRLVMDEWEQFMGERIDPDDDPNDISIPQTSIVLGDIAPTSVAGYFGLPRRNGVGAVSVSALTFRAYTLIYNEWYRDQNIQNSIPFSTGPGPDDWSHFTDSNSCYPRGKRKDYFTGALPWPQKGDPVIVPVGGDAPIIIPPGDPMLGDAQVTTVRDMSGTVVGPDGYFYVKSTVTPGDPAEFEGQSINMTHTRIKYIGGTEGDARVTDPGGAYASLSAASTVTINDLRNAIAIQHALESDARGGTRYIEIILNRFGVKSDDARLQRPEYLGGSTTTVNINPIAQTAPDSGGTPLATLAAIGTGVSNSGFQKSFTEHGIIIGLASVRSDITYQQGINRGWFRQSRDEFYWPEYAHLGEQAILNREIYVQGTADDEEVFGYQERFAEYRYKNSLITGLMASEQPSSLDVWHLSQEFADLPTLSPEFIVENPPIDRVIAVPSEPHFIADFWFDYKSDRPMPVYSVPGLDTF